MLRFLAALLVVLVHARAAVFLPWGELPASERTSINAAFFAVTRLGLESVVIFFVLSGFLVGGKAIERMRARTFEPGKFAMERISRIYLPLIPALVLSACLGRQSSSALDWAGNLAGLQHVLVAPLGANAPLWSLAYEIWFYALTFAVGLLLLARYQWMAVLICLAFVFVFIRLDVSYLICWLLGAATFVWRASIPKATGAIVGALIAVSAVVGLQLSQAGANATLTGVPLLRDVLIVLLGVGTAMFCAVLSRLPGGRIPRAFVPFAAFSYTLYLVHYPILAAASRQGLVRHASVEPASLGVFVLVVLSLLVIAWLMYLPFERNTARLRRWLSGRLIKKPAAPVGRLGDTSE